MQKPFVIFSLPGSQVFSRFEHDENGSETFVLRPFSGESIEWRGNLVATNPEEWKPALSAATNAVVPSKEQYTERLEKTIRWCAENQGKAVLSRIWDDLNAPEDPGSALKKLKAAHPGAFVYGLESSEFGCWMGATPETLLQRDADGFKTMALAGTKLLEEEWTTKERKEQQTVTDYLLEQIGAEGVNVSDPMDDPFGVIKHLKSDLVWSSSDSVIETAERLHPTPAVGGFPVEQALTFLEALEDYDRSLYTGYLGLIKDTNDAHLFVNLRCMQLFRDRIRFYAGGGVNEWSDPEAEWEETKRKIESTRALVIER